MSEMNVGKIPADPETIVEPGRLFPVEAELGEVVVETNVQPSEQVPGAVPAPAPRAETGIYEHWGSGKIVQVRADGTTTVLKLDKYS